MRKKPNDFYKISTMFKKRNPQIKEKEDLKEKVLDDVGALFNELNYVYKDKHNEEKIQKTKRNLTTKNWGSLTIMSTSLKKKKRAKL